MREFSKVLVTGGAGFIGSHLVDRLMSIGYSVRVVDNLSSGSLGNVKVWLGDSRFEFVRGDLKDLNVAKSCVDGYLSVVLQENVHRLVCVLVSCVG